MPFSSNKKSIKSTSSIRDENNSLTEAALNTNVNGNGSSNNGSNGSLKKTTNLSTTSQEDFSKPKLVFHCQLAHGSPTGLISGFTNVKELYSKIAECYDMQSNEVYSCVIYLRVVDNLKKLNIFF